MLVLLDSMSATPIVTPETNVCTRIIGCLGYRVLCGFSILFVSAGAGAFLYSKMMCRPNENPLIGADYCTEGNSFDVSMIALAGLTLCGVGAMFASCAYNAPLENLHEEV